MNRQIPYLVNVQAVVPFFVCGPSYPAIEPAKVQRLEHGSERATFIYKTFQYRLKDSHTKDLEKMASAVNFVWNYCNELTARRWQESRKILSWVELCRLMKGASVEIGLRAQTLHQIVIKHTTCCRKAKRSKLRWRSHNRSLGWVPFRRQDIKLVGATVYYNGKSFHLWLSRPVPSLIKSGSFSQDAHGRWYVNLVCQVEQLKSTGTKVIGIDLGLKDQAVCSDGTTYSRENITRKYSEQLAKAQRAHKRKRVTAIHAKVKNARKDWMHKTTTKIVRGCSQVFVGNVSPSKLKRTRFAKSVSDAGWYQFKSALEYKAIGLGVGYKEINEAFSTVTCSACGQRTGPTGLQSVGVRKWDCGNCGAHHDRDVNAATNILLSGLGHQAPEGASS